MQFFKNNFMNTMDDPAFVADIATGEILIKNDSFTHAFPSTALHIVDIFPHQPYEPLFKQVVAQLGATGLTELAAMDVVFKQTHHVPLDVSAGYFNDQKTQLYFVIKHYRIYLDFLKFSQTSVDFPESLVLLSLGEELVFHYGNKAFATTFAPSHGPSWHDYDFIQAIPSAHRQQCLRKLKKDLALGGTCHLELPLCDANGTVHQVSLHATAAGHPPYETLVCATLQIMDGFYTRAAQLERENAMFHAVSSLSNDILFRLSLDTCSVEFFGAALSQFDIAPVEQDFCKLFQHKGLVYKEDYPVFVTLLDALHQGQEGSFSLRLHSKDGRNDWHTIQYVITCDDQGLPILAMGSILNVQMDRDLHDKASLDLLTGCLNKGTFESLAMNLFGDDSTICTHGFLIVDLDNFKAINDNLGHFFGDIVLKDISAKLKRIFRDTDLVARIGGDEFAILMRDIKDSAVVKQKARDIVDALVMTYQGNNSTYDISASVGIVLYPFQADNYEDIYQKADMALYHAKHAGKKQFSIYEDAMSQGTMSNTTPFDVANRALSYYFDQEVALDTFNLLFETHNNHQAVNLVLQHLGERFGVDRCYIFSAIDSGCSAYCNTFEWCRDGIPPEIDNLSYVPFSHFNELFVQANAEGVYYCNDVQGMEEGTAREALAPQGILSMLHTYVKKDGNIKYALGFDDCTSKRIWRPTEISTLMYASKIISQFLLYHEALQQVSTTLNERLQVLDRLNFYAYIVDNETLTLQYYNNQAKEHVPGIALGNPCYRSLRNRSSQCEDCPLRLVKDSPAQRTRAINYNPHLGIHVLTTSSALSNFQGRECTFISSTDISDVVQHSALADLDVSQFTVIE